MGTESMMIIYSCEDKECIGYGIDKRFKLFEVTFKFIFTTKFTVQ